MGMSRRAALVSMGGVVGLLGLAAGGVGLAEAEVLPGKSKVDHALGRCDAPRPSADLRAAAQPPVTGSFASKARRRAVNFAISYPPGHGDGSALPVCLALHGWAATGRMAVDYGRFPQYVAAAVRDGAAPFALAAPDGGDGYWHPHPVDDPLGMLIDEFLPLLAARGLRTDRVALAGWSMGGYGALLCAMTHRDLFRTVQATSPAIFRSYADAHRVNPGAYDSPGEWARYDVTARAGELAGLLLSIAIGAADPFTPAVRRLRGLLPDPGVVTIGTGCHDSTYWEHLAPAQARSISLALS